ncbi:MAG: phosphoglucosamine mutase [Pyrinomonadaceae bacterium]
MKKLFGTDGIRGRAGTFPLDAETVCIVGRSLAKQYRETLDKNPRFITGRDTRDSGAWIEKAFHEGACSRGAECQSAGVITTPGVAFLTQRHRFDAGIVISASHNPYEDNGLKIFSSTGKKIDENIEKTIETDIAAERASTYLFEDAPAESANADRFQNDYLEYLRGEFDGLRLNGYKMVIDCANGAAYSLAPDLFRSFGADVIVINDKPDGRNINKECGSLHLEHLQAKVLQENADFGVAFDGDADRALFVDEKGKIVDGDAALWIMAQYFQDHEKLKNETVVATVMSNIGLEIALASRNLKLLRAAVGDKYVLEELLKTNSEIGGEQSGHLIFPEKSLVGDGMMTALFLLKAIRVKNSLFSEMTTGFTRFPQVLVNIKVREKHPFESIDELVQVSKIVERELSGNGRLLLRYSGTENLARVMIEGEDQNAIEGQASRLAEIIRRKLG